MATQHLIHLLNTDERYPCAEHQNVLRAMESLGRQGIPVGCRSGGCGICKVRIHAGTYMGREMSRAFVSAAEEACGVGVAGRIQPQSEMRLEAIDKLAHCVERTTIRNPSAGHTAQTHTRPITTSTECVS